MKRLSYKNGLHACIMKELNSQVNLTKQALQMVIDVIKYAFKNTDKTEQLRSTP